MTSQSRRDAFKTLLAGASLPLLPAPAVAMTRCEATASAPLPGWHRGIEGQRQADQGDVTYLNPIIAGDHPDPTVLKDGKDYYLTYSSFYSYPGLVIWHSTDLVNWRPLAPALSRPLGTIWAISATARCRRKDAA